MQIDPTKDMRLLVESSQGDSPSRFFECFVLHSGDGVSQYGNPYVRVALGKKIHCFNGSDAEFSRFTSWLDKPNSRLCGSRLCGRFKIAFPFQSTTIYELFDNGECDEEQQAAWEDLYEQSEVDFNVGRACNYHNVLLQGMNKTVNKKTDHGQTYYGCPVKNCSVGWWGNPKSLPADSMTRLARKSLFEIRGPLQKCSYNSECYSSFARQQLSKINHIGVLSYNECKDYLIGLLKGPEDSVETKLKILTFMLRNIPTSWTWFESQAMNVIEESSIKNNQVVYIPPGKAFKAEKYGFEGRYEVGKQSDQGSSQSSVGRLIDLD